MLNTNLIMSKVDSACKDIHSIAQSQARIAQALELLTKQNEAREPETLADDRNPFDVSAYESSVKKAFR